MEKLQNKKPLVRFPEFKDEWEEKKLGDVFSFRTTNSYSRAMLNYEDGTVKNIHYGDIHTKFHTLFDVTKEIVPFINSDIELKRIALENYCKEGDLVIADASEDYKGVAKCIEISNTNNEKILAGLHTILARPDIYKMAIGFNGYYMKTLNIRKQIQKIAQGSKVLSVSVKELKKIKLSIPTLPEQKRIANFFTVLDNKINQLKEKKALLEDYKKGVIQKLSATKQLKEVEFGEIAELRKKKFNTTNANESFKCIELEHIDQGTGHLLGYIQSNKQKSQKNRFYKGDVLFGKLRPYLNKFWKSEFEGVCSGEIWVLKPKNDIVTSDYLYFLIQTSQFFKTVTISSGSKMPRADWGLVSNNIISIDIDKKEQTKIANFLSKIDEKIKTVNEQIEETTAYKKGMLQKIFIQ